MKIKFQERKTKSISDENCSFSACGKVDNTTNQTQQIDKVELKADLPFWCRSNDTNLMVTNIFICNTYTDMKFRAAALSIFHCFIHFFFLHMRLLSLILNWHFVEAYQCAIISFTLNSLIDFFSFFENLFIFIICLWLLWKRSIRSADESFPKSSWKRNFYSYLIHVHLIKRRSKWFHVR